ncbi:MAG: type II toxin-antitoxin system TacA family antitoxin [Planctomycetota bacterium]|jgi:uncharacterized protein (DUF1778 family)
MATKTVRIEVRLSPEHKTLIENAAALHGQSLSAFVVSGALERARQIQSTFLTRRDWDRFLDLVDREEEPTPVLVAATRKHPRRQG